MVEVIGGVWLSCGVGFVSLDATGSGLTVIG